MNKIIIKTLILKNFKGIKELVVNFGDKTDVLGDNGTGKTTVFDAYNWLLFDKDHLDRVVGDKEANFQIKTLDSNNNVIHGLDHEVIGVFNLNGKDKVLSKIYREKWTKRRGEAEKQMTGHETEYFIDDVPVKKAEYQQEVNNIMNETIFKLISNPLYFSNNLKWQDRRDIILKIVGDITQEQIMNYKPELRALEKYLDDKDIETLKKSIAARKAKLNKDIQSIPARIDEVNNSIQELDWDSLNQELWTYENDLKQVDEELLDNSKASKDTLEKQKKLYSLKSKLQTMEHEADSSKDKPLFDLKSKLQEANFELKSIEAKLNNLHEKKKFYEVKSSELAENTKKLKEEFYKVRDAILEFNESEFICPTCKRAFDTEDIEAKKAEMLENFNQNKAKKLEVINAKGKKGKADSKKLEDDIKEINSQIEKANLYIAACTDNIEKIENEIANFKPEDTLSGNKEYQDLKKEIENIESLIAKESNSMENDDITAALKIRKQEIVSKIDEIKKQLNCKEQNEKFKTRINELMEEEKKIANQIAEAEKQEFLCEGYIKTKVELLEAGINKKFKYVSFKMFEVQQNGGVNEFCEALINGVPFSIANTASQINAGIDIINELSAYYQISAPVFIDNRESINELIECNAQLVNLIVSQDKNLKIESKEREVA
jgi:chromosome segregation ATPase